MHGHSFAGLALSLLVVALTTIALRPNDPATSPATPREAPAPAPRSPVRPSQPRAAEPEVQAPALATEPKPSSGSSPALTSPSSPFTEVREGESLADVARRVYGSDSTEAVDRLWKANRDQVRTVDVALVAGGLMRTP